MLRFTSVEEQPARSAQFYFRWVHSVGGIRQVLKNAISMSF